ncbi:MAG: DNRLRE domain-containing protein [Candidatus Krumholzibacteria bacterium]|nr:DNRLRE domain-containing protein [Candidatus Krumholzibacteria bacterium]MDH4338636.1 DNRLRE domain-containing protein [Candidatus Krumholzibacteria bacterium]MDH5271292.1 DNRLRE domain-containing protein [Candidatus Krumholzibacteria bacterium]
MKKTIGLILVAALAFSMSCGEDDDPPTDVDSTAPARVTDLTVFNTGFLGLTLAWTAPGDDGNSGTAAAYQVRESNATITSSNWDAATDIALPTAPGPAGSLESFTFTGFDTLQVHYFALRTRDDSGNWSSISNNAIWTPRGGSVQYFVEIPCYMDNTMYAESDTLSNAKGQYLFSGMNMGGAGGPADARRGLMAFAIADSIPAGAQIDSVALQLNLFRKRPGDTGNSPVSLHLVQASWGEGTSIANLGPGEGGGGSATPGDATWLDRFRGTSLWTNPGGDIDVTPSATEQTDALGKYTWASPALVANVQLWLDTPASNFGWALLGDEGVPGNVRQWDSRENATAGNRPRLTVFYTVTQ